MLAALGDLIDDIVVRHDGPIRHATDTASRIERRQGGSAANVCVVAASLGRPSRLLAQVGDDRTGRSLVAELGAAGVDTSMIRFEGTTGTIIVIVDPTGERTMLVDRRAAVALDRPDERWLDGVDTLHVPLYSLELDPIAATARAAIGAALRRGIAVSIDASSVALIDGLGAKAVRARLDELGPTVIFANEDEAGALGITGSISGAITVVKRGADAAIAHRPDADPVEVPAEPIDHVVDTTGAGDAFAAGFLARDDWRHDPVGACVAGHRAAADLLRARAIC